MENFVGIFTRNRLKICIDRPEKIERPNKFYGNFHASDNSHENKMQDNNNKDDEEEDKTNGEYRCGWVFGQTGRYLGTFNNTVKSHRYGIFIKSQAKWMREIRAGNIQMAAMQCD